MRLDRTSTIIATIGAAALGYLAVTAYRRVADAKAGRDAPALAEDEQGIVDGFSATRSAGPEAMRDPPREWTDADQASDESFPASDPPPVGSRVD